MQIIDVVGQMYMQANTSFDLPRYLMQSNYVYSMTFTNKGIEIAYERISGFFTVMDLSSNKFEREIPEVMANVK